MLTGDESCGCLTLDGHLDPTCGCYEEGMAQGKKQLEMELEAWSPGTHPPGCDCLSCRLSRSWAEGRSAQGVVNIGDASHSAQEIKVETRTWLHDYITDRGVREEEWEKVARGWANAADRGSPFMKEGLIRIFLEDFGKWLEVNRGKNLESRALGKPRLGQVGAEAKKTNVGIGKGRTTKSVWVLPEIFQPYSRTTRTSPGATS